MGWVMPEVVVQRVIQLGIRNLRNEDPAIFNDIFSQYLSPEMGDDYGQSYVDSIRKWFYETKIPIVQAFSLNPQRIPSISIHLANEQEDEGKAAIGDFYGETENDVNNTGVFTVFVDIGIHGDKDSETVLWMYYIISYIMFKEKLIAERLGLRLHTWSASDYSKERQYMAENIWSRWIRFKCTTQNSLRSEVKQEVLDVETGIEFERIGDGEGDL
jgi:hypothetical protein